MGQPVLFERCLVSFLGLMRDIATHILEIPMLEFLDNGGGACHIVSNPYWNS